MDIPSESGKQALGALVFFWAIVAGFDCVNAQCPPAEEARSVVIAKVVAIRVHGRPEYEAARAFYVHENLQPVVAEIQQTLLGPPIGNTVVIFLHVERTPQFTIEWLGSYGILAREEWKIGDTFVIVLSKRDRYNIPCQSWVPSSSARAESTAAGLGYIGGFPELEPFEDYPGYCASLQSIFRVKLSSE